MEQGLTVNPSKIEFVLFTRKRKMSLLHASKFMNAPLSFGSEVTVTSVLPLTTNSRGTHILIKRHIKLASHSGSAFKDVQFM